jgi:hypothetical protein
MPLRDYCAQMQMTTAGRRLTGLVYLRNRAGHQLAVAIGQAVASATAVTQVVQTGGNVTPLTVTVRLHGALKAFDVSPSDGYYFAAASQLPPADAQFTERYGRDLAYQQLIAKLSVAEVLDAVVKSLDKTIMYESDADGNVSMNVRGTGPIPT